MRAKHQVDDLRKANRAATTRVSGHTLRREGYAHDQYGNPTYRGEGYGLCSCGEKSRVLFTNNQRKDWHRQHKLDVLFERAS